MALDLLLEKKLILGIIKNERANYKILKDKKGRGRLPSYSSKNHNMKKQKCFVAIFDMIGFKKLREKKRCQVSTLDTSLIKSFVWCLVSRL